MLMVSVTPVGICVVVKIDPDAAACPPAYHKLETVVFTSTLLVTCPAVVQPPAKPNSAKSALPGAAEFGDQLDAADQSPTAGVNVPAHVKVPACALVQSATVPSPTAATARAISLR